jgi:predicted nucleic acid-binding protein
VSLWLDTSVLVSLYVPEPRSERVAHLVRRSGEPILFSQLHELEVVNALRLRIFRRDGMQKLVDATVARLQEDLHEGTLQRAAIDWPLTMAKAIELANQHTARLGCRSLDLLHVAAAVLSGSRRFVTADRRQSQVARRAGLLATRLS